MLVHLRITNFAIIDTVDLDTRPGFTVVTGETGAGKSILVGALSLALGGRASSDLVRAGAESAEVEALFDISQQPAIRARLEGRELVGDDPNALLVRRVVGARGRGKVIINGRLSTVASLGEIVRGLVDISGQHDQQSLLDTDNHLEILDAFGAHDALKNRYRTAFEELRSLEGERIRLRRGEEESLRRADFLRFQLEEIERLAPLPGEDETLDGERRRLAHAEKLQAGAQAAEGLLYGEDGSAFDKLGKAAAEVESLAQIDDSLVPTVEVLESARREIEEAARTLARYAAQVEGDPARLAEVDDRLAEIRRLCRKHGGTLAEVIAGQHNLAGELESLENADARLAELEVAVATSGAKARELALELSECRRRAARRLERSVLKELAQMELEAATFRARPERRRHPTDGFEVEGEFLGATGVDRVELLWSANAGEPPRPLVKTVSGGELSRLMLAVKTVLCNRDLVSLYVFDEVDAGLGGHAADSIGRKIQAVAGGHQAITITHLAPIAARADHHLRVSKESRGKRTVSRFDSIDGTERAEEIARMLGGATVTEAARQTARELLGRRP